MGTNYYLDVDVCPTCGRGSKRHHIGKSSAGWAFALHVDEAEGLNGLWDWEARWALPFSRIVDEYGERVDPSKMSTIIATRPSGVLHHDHNCIRQCGSYDLIQGEFS